MPFPTKIRKTDLSAAAQERFARLEGRPRFLADWDDALFLHYAIDPAVLRPHVPFELDLRDGMAYISLVAFTQRRLRPVLFPAARWLMRPLAEHAFLNVRTYVWHGDERGIFFLIEWVPSRSACLIGPRLYGLPYRLAALDYRHDRGAEELTGVVTTASHLAYCAHVEATATPQPCEPGSLDEFLLERYIAFTERRRRRRAFRIWHPPWPQVRVDGVSIDGGLLTHACPWMRQAELMGGNFSAGVHDVCIGPPHRVA